MTVIAINDTFHIGDTDSCFYEDKEGWIVIHACKSPCHQRSVGYIGNLSPVHPNYLIKEDGHHLFLNMVDMNTPLMPRFAEPIFKKGIEFIKKNIEGNKVLIHCNMGLSRSPSIALLYMAKISKGISNEDYDCAKNDFLKIYPAYNPGFGIDDYLRKHWTDLD